jgi:ribosome-binding factor A
MSDRSSRLSAAVKAELPAVIRSHVKDPRVARAGLLTVTKVEVSRDGRVAKVGVSFVGGSGDPDEAVAALERTAGYLRGEVGRLLGVRHAPELRFVHDRSGEYAAHIDALLKEDKT